MFCSRPWVGVVRGRVFFKFGMDVLTVQGQLVSEANKYLMHSRNETTVYTRQ